MSRPQILSNPDFLNHLIRCIDSAGKEIIISTYLFNLTEDGSDPVGLVVEALIRARHRGVKVDIFLEGSQRLRAVRARNILEAGGISVNFDTPATFLHEKVVIVDRRKVFIGSQNLTRVSLTTNIELAVYLEDPGIAAKILKNVEGRGYEPEDVIELKGTPIPAGFIIKDAAALLKNNAHRCFNLYIQLLRLSGVKQVVKGKLPEGSLDYKELAASLGMEKPKGLRRKESDYSRYYYSNVMQEILLDLERNYGLIDYDAGSRSVRIRGLKGGGRLVTLPDTYFEYGWDKRLSLPAKVSLLIHIYETGLSKSAPWWFRSQKDISGRYGLYPDTFSKGSRELRYFNLVEIEGRMQPRGRAFSERPANHYRLRPFYSVDDFSRRLDDFRREKGGEDINKILELARELGEPWDLSVIQELADLNEEYGMKRLTEAHKKVTGLATHNPLRHVTQIRKLLR